MTGPSSLPSGNCPAEVRPDGAAVPLAPALGAELGVAVGAVHAARKAAPLAAADIFRRSRRLRPLVARRSRVAIRDPSIPRPFVPVSYTNLPTSEFDIGLRYLTAGW